MSRNASAAPCKPSSGKLAAASCTSTCCRATRPKPTWRRTSCARHAHRAWVLTSASCHRWCCLGRKHAPCRSRGRSWRLTRYRVRQGFEPLASAALTRCFACGSEVVAAGIQSIRRRVRDLCREEPNDLHVCLPERLPLVPGPPQRI